MFIRELWYDNVGIARAIILSNSGKEYSTSIDRDLGRTWCSCPAWIYKKDKVPCKHIMFLLGNIDRSKMVKKEDLDYLGTGSNILDTIFGGGIPYGIVTAVYGEPTAGKSMFAYQMTLANIKNTKNKTLFLDTEGLRPQDLRKILFKFKPRWGLSDEQVIAGYDLKTTLGDLHLLSIQKLFEMFGYLVTFELSKNGKYTPKFQPMKPSMDEDDWKKYSMIILDSLTKPIKDSMGANTANLPARAQIIERLFGCLYNVAMRHNIAIIINHHATCNPITPFGRDFGKMWGGDPVLYNSKYAIEFIDAPSKLKAETGWNQETRRVKLVRHPYEQATGKLIPIRLSKDRGFVDE